MLDKVLPWRSSQEAAEFRRLREEAMIVIEDARVALQESARKAQRELHRGRD